MAQFFSDYRQVYDPRDAEVLVANQSPSSQHEFFRVVGPKHLRLFLGGEAVVPDFNVFDYAIGFPNMTIEDRYIRVHPLLYFSGNFDNQSLPPREYSERDAGPSFEERTGISFIYSNRRAHPMRDELFHRLSMELRVDSLGHHLNSGEANRVQLGTQDSWISEKIAAEQQYRFSISAENARFDGYTSEKIITALVAGTVPIYWGNPSISRDFNPQRFIELVTPDSLDEVVATVSRLDSDKSEWEKTASAPWLTPQQDALVRDQPKVVTDFFSAVFAGGQSSVARRGTGSFPQSYELVRLHRISGGVARLMQFIERRQPLVWRLAIWFRKVSLTFFRPRN